MLCVCICVNNDIRPQTDAISTVRVYVNNNEYT